MQNNWPRGTAGRVVWGGRGGTRGLRAGGRCPEAVWETPPHPLRLAQRPEGPRSALPAEHLPLGTAWRYAGPPPTKGKGAPPGQPLGLELVLFPCTRLPPSEQIPHCPPASCSQPLLQCCTPRWEEQGPAVHELSFIGSSQSVRGGGGQCERPLGVELRVGLAAVGPRLGAAAGQEDPAGPDLQEQLGHGYGASPPVLRSMGLFGFLWALHALGKC